MSILEFILFFSHFSCARIISRSAVWYLQNSHWKHHRKKNYDFRMHVWPEFHCVFFSLLLLLLLVVLHWALHRWAHHHRPDKWRKYNCQIVTNEKKYLVIHQIHRRARVKYYRTRMMKNVHTYFLLLYLIFQQITSYTISRINSTVISHCNAIRQKPTHAHHIFFYLFFSSIFYIFSNSFSNCKCKCMR